MSFHGLARVCERVDAKLGEVDRIGAKLAEMERQLAASVASTAIKGAGHGHHWPRICYNRLLSLVLFLSHYLQQDCRLRAVETFRG
jgi:hypothetical protein